MVAPGALKASTSPLSSIERERDIRVVEALKRDRGALAAAELERVIPVRGRRQGLLAWNVTQDRQAGLFRLEEGRRQKASIGCKLKQLVEAEFASQTLPEGAGSPAVVPSKPYTLIRFPALSNSSTPSSMSPTQRSPAALQVRLSGNGEDANRSSACRGIKNRVI